MVSSSMERNPWMSCARLSPKVRLRLFCFPYSGAGASVFYGWSAVLPPAIEVCPMQLPGRENRLMDPPFAQLPPLVEAAGKALLPYLDKPFAFFGHSLGALVTFELARLLRRDHALRPVKLFVSGHSAPHIPDTEPPIHNLPQTEFLERIRGLNGMSEAVLENAELMELLVPILRADFSICETYAYRDGTPLDCPISALGGLQDRHVSRADLEGWRQHTSASFSLRMFPGGHFYLNSQRALLLQTVARDLSDSKGW